MSHSELIEWACIYRMESGEAPPTAAPWEKMLQSMRLVSELQKVK